MRLHNSVLMSTLFAALVYAAVPVEAAGHGGGGGGFLGGAGGGFHGGEFHGGGGGFRGGDMHDHGHGDGFDHHGFDRDHFHGGFGHGFAFRPRFGVGFGVFLGYPFGYPFYDPWDYWAYPYGPLAFVPGAGYGGVSFSISPGDAAITVDSTYAGTVDQFNDPSSPLNLPPGQHHVEIQAPGYRTLDFDVTIQGGQVIPYAGDLQHN
jgi:hypothetical protein